MDWAAKGAAALTAGGDQVPLAVTYYTKALIEHPTSPDYYTQRAIAFSRLTPTRHDLALRDAEFAVLLSQKRARREKIQAAQQRRVVALYGLNRYEDAKYILMTMQKWRLKDNKKDKMEHDTWTTLIDRKLKTSDSQAHTVQEYPEIDLPDEAQLKKILQGQLADAGSFRSEHGKNSAEESIPAVLDKLKQSTQDDSASSKTSQQPERSAVPVRHDYYQNSENLIVTFYAKKVDPSQVICHFERSLISLSFPHPDNALTTFSFTVDPTFANLDKTASTFKVFGTKIELTLAKEEKGLKWTTLESTHDPIPVKLPNPYVTKNKDDLDWETRTAELTKKQRKKKKLPNETRADQSGSDPGESDAGSEFGDDPVDGFFKKLYKGADDDTRRAMMKSFTESNGTSLSTNWSDVSKGKVEEVRSKRDD